MKRHPGNPLEVHCTPDGRPEKLCFGPAPVRIEKVLDRWVDTGCWWEGESEKMFYRLYCQDGGVCEIFYDLASEQWFLYKVYD